MFLRCKKRRKDGKEHHYWSIVENRRVMGGCILQQTCGNHTLQHIVTILGSDSLGTKPRAQRWLLTSGGLPRSIEGHVEFELGGAIVIGATAVDEESVADIDVADGSNASGEFLGHVESDVLAERLRAGGIAIGHVVNIAAAATGRDGTETFRARKGRQGHS